MKQFFNIFKFEFGSYLKNKVFIGVTLVLILAVGIVLFWPRISNAIGFGDSNETGSDDKSIILLADETSSNPQQTLEMFQLAMEDKTIELTDKSEEDLKTSVDNEECDSAILITGDTTYQYIVKNLGMYDSTTEIIDEIMQTKYRIDSMTNLGVAPEQAGEILSVQIESEVIQTGKDQMKNFFYTYVLIFALYMAILLYGQFVATGVASEKSSRAMELLITSAKPVNLMFGKVIGIGSAGILQLVLVFGSSFVFFNVNKNYWEDNQIVNSIFNMPVSILLYTILFFVLGYFIYSFLYGAVGSLVSKVEDLNTAVTPITFIFIAAFIIIMFSLGSGDVDSTIMIAASYIPLTSPMAMFVRIAMSEVAAYEIIISVAILLVSTIGIGYLSAKIYQMGVLMYGKAPSLFKAIRSLKDK